MKQVKLILLGALSGILNGFFGSGGGIVAVLALERITSLPTKKAHATAIAVILPLTLVSLFGYKAGGFLDWYLIIPSVLGGSLGGIIGAKLLSRLSPFYIHKVFGGILFLSAIRMVFS